MAEPRVLVIHNRYRQTGGEEQALALHLRALRDAGIEHRVLERRSAGAPRLRAGVAMLRGGQAADDVRQAATALSATVVHCHNLQPLLGPRALAAARVAGARVVLHLHNFRLFCAIGVSFRDGAPCFRCRDGLTAPGLALNCRGNLPGAAVYAVALARQLRPLLELVDLFVVPSAWAAGQLVRLGLPADRVAVLPHYLPDERVAGASNASAGGYALALGRLAPEKGFEVAIDAAGRSGVPLRIAGDGPLAESLARAVATTGAEVELLGAVGDDHRDHLLAGAAMLVMPTVGNETFGYVALEAMGAGVPVVATRAGALPEVVGEAASVPRGDASALADRMRALFVAPDARERAGTAALERARSFSEERFSDALLALYAGA
jgi:glycosyltransferase involved in cell wall biosynthesis